MEEDVELIEDEMLTDLLTDLVGDYMEDRCIKTKSLQFKMDFGARDVVVTYGLN